MRSGTRTQASARTVVISISTDKYANVPRPKTEIYRRTDANTYKGIQLKTHQMPRAPAPDRRSFCVEPQRRNRQRHHHKRLLTNVALRFRDSIVGSSRLSCGVVYIGAHNLKFAAVYYHHVKSHTNRLSQSNPRQSNSSPQISTFRRHTIKFS
jgi:hypothetical protein